MSADGKLCSAPFSAEYAFSLPLENMSKFELGEGVCVMAHGACESSGVRVSAPRRLQIRSHLKTAVSAYGKMLCAENVSGMSGEGSIERLCENATSPEIFCESSDVITLQDDFSMLDVDRRISVASSNVFIGETQREEDAVRVRGEVLIELLLSDTEAQTERMTRRLPFDVNIDLDGIELSDDSRTRVGASVTDLVINSEDGNVRIEANMVLELCAIDERRISYTKDMYSTAQECKCSKAVYELPVMLCNKNFAFSQSERLLLEEIGIEPGVQIADVNSSAIVEGIDLNDGKYTLRGSCKYNLVLKKDGEYSAAEVKTPFRFDIDGDRAGEIERYDAIAEMYGTKAKLDGTSLNIDSQIALACTLFGKDRIEAVEKAELFGECEKRTNSIIVCFPSSDDTLWSIAKRYGVLMSDVCGDIENDGFVMIET